MNTLSETMRRARQLLIPLAVVLPIAACLGGEKDEWGVSSGSRRAKPRDDSRWPAPTPPNGADPGTASSASAYAVPLPGSAGMGGSGGQGNAGHGGGGASAPASVPDGGPGPDANGAPEGGTSSGGAGGHAAACGCEAGAKRRTPVCQFDNQCGSRARCQDGICERECRDSSTCGTGQVCAQAYCHARPGGGGACIYDADCGGGATCIDGTCHSRCSGDAACGAADRCVEGVCRPDVGPWPQCVASSECATGRECVNAVCRTRCAADADCCAGTSGSYCRAGVCVTAHEAAPQCRLSVDCGTSQACIDAACS